jgi:hypothetical protein
MKLALLVAIAALLSLTVVDAYARGKTCSYQCSGKGATRVCYTSCW